MNWKRATGAACVASIATSLLLNFTLELSARHKLFSLPYGMNVGAFSLLVSLVVFIGVSWATGRDEERRLPPDVKAVMEI